MDIDGLAGFTAAGLTGLGAGMSHSPTDPNGRERYVFFAMPHIAVDSSGRAGDCIRAGRAGCSHACGALIKLQPKFTELKAGGLQIRAPGTCDHMITSFAKFNQAGMQNGQGATCVRIVGDATHDESQQKSKA